MVSLKIDPEFRDKVPAMSDDEFEGLKRDILRDGYVRDPLVVWDEENTILDGHHRWRVICENWETLEHRFTIDRKSFADRWECIAWICSNQLHKRNVSEIQRMKLLQEEHDARKKTQGTNNQYVQAKKSENGETHQFRSNNPKANQIRAELANEHDITESEVRTAVEVGRGIDRAASVDPDFKREVLSGAVKARKGDLAKIRKLDTEKEISEAIESIRNPQAKSKREHTKEDREVRNQVKVAIESLYDTENCPEYTADDLAEDIRMNAEQFVQIVRNILTERSTVLTEESRPMIARVITDSLITEFTKVRDLLT
jgi:cupin superfamily acireductone dioxygenase involved in methionine salvage